MPRTLRRITGSADVVVAAVGTGGGGRERCPSQPFSYFSSTRRGLYGNNWPWRIKSGVRYHASDVVVNVSELAFFGTGSLIFECRSRLASPDCLSWRVCNTKNMSKIQHDIDFKY